MRTGRAHLGTVLIAAALGGATAVALPVTAMAAIPAHHDRHDGDHPGTHRGDDTGRGDDSNSSSSRDSSSSRNSNNSSSGASGSSLIELNNVLDNSLNQLSIHVLGG